MARWLICVLVLVSSIFASVSSVKHELYIVLYTISSSIPFNDAQVAPILFRNSFGSGIMIDMDDDFISLADAATRLGVTVRQCQRQARRLTDADRQIRDHGAVWVRWSVFQTLSAHRAHAVDPSRDQNSASTATVATLEAEVARLTAEVEELKSERSRHLDIMLAQASAMGRPDHRPLLLAQDAGQDGTTRPHVPFWRAWWGRRQG